MTSWRVSTARVFTAGKAHNSRKVEKERDELEKADNGGMADEYGWDESGSGEAGREGWLADRVYEGGKGREIDDLDHDTRESMPEDWVPPHFLAFALWSTLSGSPGVTLPSCSQADPQSAERRVPGETENTRPPGAEGGDLPNDDEHAGRERRLLTRRQISTRKSEMSDETQQRMEENKTQRNKV